MLTSFFLGPMLKTKIPGIDQRHRIIIERCLHLLHGCDQCGAFVTDLVVTRLDRVHNDDGFFEFGATQALLPPSSSETRSKP